MFLHNPPGMKMVVFTGAGVSTPSGMSDFRSQSGVEANINKPLTEALSRHELYCNPERFWNTWEQYLRVPDNLEPNIVHEAIALFESRWDITVVTQNIDELHEQAGSSRVLHLHGTSEVFCEKCKMPALPNGKKRHVCGGKIRPNAVLYGEQLNTQVINTAVQAIREADILLTLGTSLKVHPAAGLLNYYTGTEAYFFGREMPDMTGIGVQFRYAIAELEELFEPFAPAIAQ